ncbi:Probable phospholipid-transporting ATPase DRS2 [Babesia microti strain RI]|uniref:adenylate cyclase n=1 Tax=Babesia microti (strain RI) TaxID=1133968 RepID=A0A1R4AB73_BABMR|nr:Probable phospholipid-transporting ATPase DRS2 [Babesia microti strain RI]SJK86205.1 Probable phospholipid-transporting ATPase DRS2 [Babesia microti strain RI]|eukprot:XP_021338393.1 Probable phospholipid-transporting ATPase DRS2 [Babesia microti strain RI]
MNFPHGERQTAAQSKAPQDAKATSRTLQNGTARKVAMLDKRQKICQDAKSRPLWELRTLQINPTSDRESAVFPSNSLHTGPLRLALLVLGLLLNTLVIRVHTLVHLLFFALEYILWRTVDDVYFSVCPYVPLWASILVSLLHGGVEVANKYRLGKLIDTQQCHVVDPRRPRVMSVSWADLTLGSIVKLTAGEESPADIVPISTSGSNGVVCVDTSLVDGSGDLKIKSCVKDAGIEASLHTMCRIRGQIVCNKPSASTEFTGTLKLRGFPRSNVLTTSNFIQRGSIVRNAASVYGVVVYTGRDTKFGINSQRNTLFKTASIDRDINIYTMGLLLLFTACWVTSLILHHSHASSGSQNPTANSVKFTKVLKFASLYLSLVPNTMGALLDLNRLLQCARIKLESAGAPPPAGPGAPDIIPLSGTRNEELGRVDFVFTGYRGVITKLKPEIAFIRIGDSLYSGGPQRAIDTCYVAPSGVLEPLRVPLRPASHLFRAHREPDAAERRERLRSVDRFLKLCSMCNISTTVLGGGSRNLGSCVFSSSKSLKIPPRASALGRPRRRPHATSAEARPADPPRGYRVEAGAGLGGRLRSVMSLGRAPSRVMIDYMSLYPEDDCLVGFAFDRGYKLLYKSASSIAVLVRGKVQCWEILGLHAPSPQRNRVSLVLRPVRRADWQRCGFKPMPCSYAPDARHERIARRCRGAIVLSRFTLPDAGTADPDAGTGRGGTGDLNDSSGSNSLNSLNFSGGLKRVQLYYRWLTEGQLGEYLARKGEGSSGVFAPDEEAVASVLERDLQLVATIGFRAELAEGVAETMARLAGAGVRVCLATGGERDGCVSAAHQGGLLRDGARLFSAALPESTELCDSGTAMGQINAAQEDQGRQQVRALSAQLLESFYRARGECWASGPHPSRHAASQPHRQLCLTLCGRDVESFAVHSDMETCLANMICLSDVIVAHDMLPQHKGRLVELLKGRLTPAPSVLAVGYSYDDVCACRASDVAVALARPDCQAVGVRQVGGNKLVCWSDYLVGGFSSLTDLLFFHGSVSLVSTSAILSQLVYLGVCQGALCFLYQAFTGWAALPLYPRAQVYAWCAFAAVFSALHAAFIRRTAPRALLRGAPLLYALGRRRYYLNGSRFGQWVAEAVATSVAVFFTAKAALDDSPYLLAPTPEGGVGLTVSASAYNALMAVAVLLVGNMRVSMQCNAWMLHSHGVSVGLASLLALFAPTVLTVLLLGTGALSRQLSRWPYTWVLVPLWVAIALVGSEAFALLGKRLRGDVLDRFHARAALLLRDASRCLKRGVALGPSGAMVSRGRWHWLRPQVWTLTPRVTQAVADAFGDDPALAAALPAPRAFAVREAADVVKHEEDAPPPGATDHVQTSHLLNRVTLWFKDPQLEAEYVASRKRSEYFSSVLWYRCVFSVFFVFYIASWVVEHQVARAWSFGARGRWGGARVMLALAPLLLVLLALAAGIVATFYRAAFSRHSKLVQGAVVAAVILQNLGAEAFCAQEFRDSNWFHSILFPIFTFVILRLPFLAALVSNLFFILANVVLGHALPPANGSSNFAIWSQEMPLYIGINLLVVLVGYRLEYNARKSFILEYAAACARRRQREILNTMLPHFVVAHMINEERTHEAPVGPVTMGLAAEERDAVTVLFCDVYRFQNWVAILEPTKLVELLDVLFLAFDKCAQEFGCTKIETVFESYLAAAGLSLDARGAQECPAAAAARAVDLALAMLQAVALLHADAVPAGERLQVVIGAHTGRVICGVVGSRKPQYALFGDTVNTASRMKYTGEPGHVHISSHTHALVSGDSTLSFERRETSVKGKGLMETYLLRAVAGSQYPSYQGAAAEGGGERARVRRQIIAAALGERDESLETPSGAGLSQLFRESVEELVPASGCLRCLSGRYGASSAYEAEEAVAEEGVDDPGLSSKAIGWVSLKFTDKLLEEKYRLNFYSDRANVSTIEQTLAIFIIIFVAQTVTSMGLPRIFLDPSSVQHRLFVNYLSYWSVRSGYTVGAFVLWFYFHHHSSTREAVVSKWMIFFLSPLFVSAACIFSLSNSWAIAKEPLGDSQNLWLSCDSIEFYFYICLLHHNTGMLFQTCILVDLLLITMSITFISSSVVKTAVTSVTIFNIPCFILFNLISAHCKETIDRRTFYANERAKAIEAKASQLLKDMLPKNVLEEFQMDKLRLAYRHENMSFLFADIVGFTTWAKSVDASEVLNMLQNLFARFDRNSTKFGLYKLCTIGDAYVAVSEPTTAEDAAATAADGTEGVLLMAHSMLASIQEIRERLGIPGLNMRIGLHFGSAVGGVIGSGRLRYDLWGMDILTANMMESNGAPGKINVSERFRDILMLNSPNRFTYTFNKEVRVIDQTVRSYILGPLA